PPDQDQTLLASLLQNNALVSEATGEWPAALDRQQQALAIRREAEDARGAAQSLHGESGRPTAGLAGRATQNRRWRRPHRQPTASASTCWVPRSPTLWRMSGSPSTGSTMRANSPPRRLPGSRGTAPPMMWR